MEAAALSEPASGPYAQGQVLISDPSPLTGERELTVVVSSDIYNRAGAPTVVVAEVETGTRFRATSYATETDYGVVLADRVQWLPTSMAGERFGIVTEEQRRRIADQVVAVTRGH